MCHKSSAAELLWHLNERLLQRPRVLHSLKDFRKTSMAIVRFRCSDDLAARFEVEAKRRGCTTSQLGRAVLEKITSHVKSAAAETQSSSPGEGEADKVYEPRTFDLRTRLTKNEREAVEKRAAAMGMKPYTWLMRLVRAHLAKQPELTFEEVQALREATRELSYIGRNLNQVAHGLNISAHAREKASVELIVEINEKVDSIRTQIKEVLDRNLNRWGV